VLLSGANDLSGLMVVNAGSLVIANAGLLTRGALTVRWDWSGAGSGCYGAECVCVPAGEWHSAEWEFDGEQLWAGVWVGECGVGRDRDTDEEHWRHGGVEWCE
jgi:autotransporter-associated beta strand protein